MGKIEGWRKFLAYVVCLLVLALPDTFKHALDSSTMNTIENISIFYLGGQSAIDIVGRLAEIRANKTQEKKI